MRIATLNNYKDVFKYVSNTHQVTVQELLNGRTRGGKRDNWVNVNVSDELREQVIDDLLDTLGGRETTKGKIRSLLSYHTPQHWGLNRMHIVKRSNGIVVSYCAGQDYPAELAQIRKDLTK
jgi:hypothetical protein